MSVEPKLCRNCLGAGWVCEDHLDQPGGGTSSSEVACDCGAGAPCPICNEMSWNHLGPKHFGDVEKLRALADKAISCVEDAVRETSWGQPTFGSDAGEELRAEFSALFAKLPVLP